MNITRAKAITQYYTQAQIEVICKETKKEANEGLHLPVMEFLARTLDKTAIFRECSAVGSLISRIFCLAWFCHLEQRDEEGSR